MKVILLHGFLGSARNWGPLIYELQRKPTLKGFSFEAHDLLAHGDKLFVDDSLSLDSIVAEMLNWFPLRESCAVLCHSFGLMPLLRLCYKHGTQVALLMAEDTGPKISMAAFDEINRVFYRVKMPHGSRQAAKNEIEDVFAKGSSMAKFLFSHVREIENGSHGWRFEASKLQALLKSVYNNPLLKEWSNFNGKIFHVRGAQSQYLTSEAYKELKSLETLQSVDYYEIGDAGHWIHADQPELFGKWVESVLLSRHWKRG